jgi:hypothetical protein
MQHCWQQLGHTQKNIRRKQKNNPAPANPGPNNFNSDTVNPFSPIPMNVIINPNDIMPRPRYNITFVGAFDHWLFAAKAAFDDSAIAN